MMDEDITEDSKSKIPKIPGGKNKTPPKRRNIHTRSSQHFFFKSQDLPRNELPTVLQLLEYYYYLKDIKNVNVNTDIFLSIAIDLIPIWNKGGIPTILLKSVRNKAQ